jgi:hypothetical protein
VWWEVEAQETCPSAGADVAARVRASCSLSSTSNEHVHESTSPLLWHRPPALKNFGGASEERKPEGLRHRERRKKAGPDSGSKHPMGFVKRSSRQKPIDSGRQAFSPKKDHTFYQRAVFVPNATRQRAVVRAKAFTDPVASGLC